VDNPDNVRACQSLAAELGATVTEGRHEWLDLPAVRFEPAMQQ
jgi:hypothetical protein